MSLNVISSDEDNNWLNRTPTQGNPTGGAPTGGAAGIDVQPDGVKLFGSQATGEAETFVKNFKDGVSKLIMEGAGIGASFQEAEYFVKQHADGINQLSVLTGDVTQGLVAFGLGARTVALKYQFADTTSAATMSDVQSAFDVSGGKGYHDQPAPPPGPTGQQAPVKLPPPQYVDSSDMASYNPNDPSRTEVIGLGDNAFYIVPGASLGDMELVDNQQFTDLAKATGDDTQWTPASVDGMDKDTPIVFNGVELPPSRGGGPTLV